MALARLYVTFFSLRSTGISDHFPEVECVWRHSFSRHRLGFKHRCAGDWVVLCTLRVGSAAESGHGLRQQFALQERPTMW